MVQRRPSASSPASICLHPQRMASPPTHFIAKKDSTSSGSPCSVGKWRADFVCHVSWFVLYKIELWILCSIRILRTSQWKTSPCSRQPHRRARTEQDLYKLSRRLASLAYLNGDVVVFIGLLLALGSVCAIDKITSLCCNLQGRAFIRFEDLHKVPGSSRDSTMSGLFQSEAIWRSLWWQYQDTAGFPSVADASAFGSAS